MNWWVKSIKSIKTILASTITGCIPVSTSLIGIFIAITSSAIGLKTCAIAGRIKKYKSIIKEKKKKHNKMVLLTKCKLNSREFLISKGLFDSNISHNKFVLINNVLKEYDKMKKEIKNLNT